MDNQNPPAEDGVQQMAAAPPPLFFQKRFWPLWSAFSLGAFADNMLRQALIIGISFGMIAVNIFSNSDDAIPVIGSLFAVSMLLFSPLAGQFADKYDTAMMARRTKLIEMLIMAVAAVGFFIGNGPLLIGCLFAMGVQSAFFSPVRTGAMPKYFAPDELIRANALFNAGLFVAIILGLLFGGLFIEQPSGGEKVSGFLIGASVLGYLAVRSAPKAAATAPELKIDWNIFAQGVRIFGFALKAPGVSRPMIGFSLFYFMSTFVTVLLPLYVRDALGGTGAVATAIMGLFAIGAGLGAIGASLLSKGKSGLGFAAVGISSAGLITLAIYALTGPVALAGASTVAELFTSPAGVAIGLCFVATSASMGLYIVPLQAAVQRRAPAEKRARILAANNMLVAAMAFLGSNAVLAVTRTSLTPTGAFLIVAAMQFAIALYMFRRKRAVKEGLFDEMLVGERASP